MSYHIEDARGSFNELPERILMREDGYLGAYKFHGEPIIDYWYVPETRVKQLEDENAKLRDERDRMYKANVEKNGEILRLLKDNAKLRKLCARMFKDFVNCDCELKARAGRTFMAFTRYVLELQELGIEVDK